jgi:iron complex outermembrane receptor protein
MATYLRAGVATLLLAESSICAWSPALAAESASEAGSAGTAPLQEVMVTARRRSESLQKTPVSVVALSTESLETRSVTNLRSLQNYVPNLTFAASQNVGEAAGNAFIRGIGQEDFIAGAEPGIGFYLDGVYFARMSGTLMNLTDVERIEVLRGPQGTLFGKNTIGGAINLVSVMPHNASEGHVSVIAGNYNRVELKGMLNDPLTENLFVRLSVSRVDRDGYGRRLAPPNILGGTKVDNAREGDDHGQAARVQLRWLATDTFTTDLSLDGSRKRNHQGVNHIDQLNTAAGFFPAINNLIAQGKLPGPTLTSALIPQDLLESYAGGNNFANQDIWGASLTLTQSLGENTLKFIGAYRHLRNRVGTDPDGLYFDIVRNEFRENQHQYSGELQWNATAGSLTYTAGLFAFREDAESLPTALVGQGEVLYTCGCFYTTPPNFTTSQSQLSSKSYAAYTQGTYKLTESLSTTLGARHSQESKSIASQVVRLDANLQPTGVVTGQGANDDDFSSFTYRAGLEYQAMPDLMLYASVAKGYKSGGFNARPTPSLQNLGLTSFEPETALTYEIGARSEWFERRLRVNATLFHTSYDDIQLREQAIVGGVTTTLIGNAAKARIRGAELEIVAAPVDRLTLTASYGHLDPKYLDVGTAPGITLNSKFQRAPSDSASAAIDYEFALAGGTLQLHGDYAYRSKEQFQLTASPFDQEPYGLVSARISLRPQNARWSLALFGTNLTDERYRTAGRASLINQVGFAYSSIGMPRQYGVQVRTSF